MPNTHSSLSPSSSHRWLACPPSARLCAAVEGMTEAGPFAKQGTDAHALAEHKVLIALGRDSPDPTENLDYFDGEMDSCTDEYRNFVLEQVEEAKKNCKDPLVLVEQKLDFSHWVPDGFGTGDCVIVADDTLQVIDFKYGLGILVDAKDNSQMRCYALGALDAFDGIYDIRTVQMTIFQPRRNNISTDSMSKEDLLSWADTVLAPTAKLAAAGEGEFKAGDHCQFCKVKATCRERAAYNLKLAAYDFAPPETLEPLEIASILDKVDNLVSWAGDVKEYALRQAQSGTEYEGWKVVEGRSVRKYRDDAAVAAAVTAAGYDPYEQKLLGVTAMTSLLGKKKFNEILGSLVYKPPGKPTLAPTSDKRPAYNTAQNDFMEDN
ncbi:MAG: DUF2800 domain-containing protein [Lachnospiraceae bacterium]|nr:DUF2800 domain-containing protein [Lachnospiraceae bacterium]